MVDPAAGQAWRASLIAADDWTRSVLKEEGGELIQLPLDFAHAPVTAAAAPPVNAQPAAAALGREPDGRVTLRFKAPPGASSVIVTLQSKGAIHHLSLNGKPVQLSARQGKAPYTLAAGKRGRITWHGSDGATLSFNAEDASTLQVRTAAFYGQWLGTKPLAPLPADAEPWGRAGSSVVLGGATLLPIGP